MAKSGSGRIVAELEPSLKRKLYSVLAMENKTLKEWITERAEQYLSDNSDKIEKSEAARN
jgi:hypothetical protein